MNTDYKGVTNIDELRDYINFAPISGDKRVIAFDFETSPDEKYRTVPYAALDSAKAHIVGCSFSVGPGSGVYVPIAHRIGVNMDTTVFFDFLREFLLSGSIVKIAHNISFESAMAYHQGIVIQAPTYDTIVASQLTLKSHTSYRALWDSGLKTLAPKLCGEELPTFSDVTKGRHFDELDPQDYETVRYGAADSDFAFRLYNIFNDWFDRFLPRHRWLVENMESQTAVYLGIMKHNGFPVDLPLMQSRKIEAECAREEIKDKIVFMIGDVNIGENASTGAFKNYLYKTLKLPVLRQTEKGLPALDDSTLILLKEWCDEHMPEMSELFVLVQDYRKWGKITSTYIDGYLQHINDATGRIHPDFYALSTDTGRMNCKKPNAQNMPRKTNDPIGIRNFIAAPEGKLIISLDFSQIELRVGAFYCRDQVMMDTYRTGGDIHAATTSVIFGCTYEEAQDKHREGYKEQRTIAKNCNFGTFYGLFPKGLQQTLRFKAGVDKSFEECAAIIDNLKAGYKGFVSWQEATKAEAARKGYSETWLGRRRYLPDIYSEDWGKKSFAERCSLNTPIQGTAADILKLAICRILAGLPERPWLEPILQIHDELTFVIPEDKLEDAISFIKVCMEEKPFPEFDLPLIAEASAGKTFGTMEELED